MLAWPHDLFHMIFALAFLVFVSVYMGWRFSSDGRLAVNMGTVVLVYQPRFEGKQRYGFTAYSIQCPDADNTLLDLQRYPGQVRRFSTN